MHKERGIQKVQIVIAGAIAFVVVIIAWSIIESTLRRAAEPTSTNGRLSTIQKGSNGYLQIKEWGIEFKVTKGATGMYYKLMKDEGGYDVVRVYNENFDKLTGKNGKSCKNEVLYTIDRYDSDNDDRLGNAANRPDVQIDGKGYAGTGANRQPPECARLTDANEITSGYDQKIIEAFTQYRDAISESFDDTVRKIP